jgi:hypothetical protein
MSLEQEVYLESLQVLSELDDDDEDNDDDDDDDSNKPYHHDPNSPLSLLAVTPLTSRMRGGEPTMIPWDNKTIADDTCYRNHNETNQQIQMVFPNNNDDDYYYYNPLQLPEYKAYICVRYIRKRKYRILLILMMGVILFYGAFQLYVWFRTSMSQTLTQEQQQSKNITLNETYTN